MANWLQEIREFDFNNADKEEMGIWPTPIKILILSMIVIVIGFSTYQFSIKNMRNQINSNINMESEKIVELQLKAASSASVHKYKKQMIEVQKMLNQLVSRLPTEIEIPELLDDINESAIDSGLEIRKIDLLDEFDMKFYVEMPINIIVVGGYQDVLTFIGNISNLDRIVVVKDVVMERDSENMVNANIVAKTFRYVEYVEEENDEEAE